MHLLLPGDFIFMVRRKFFIGFLLSGAVFGGVLFAVSLSTGEDVRTEDGTTQLVDKVENKKGIENFEQEKLGPVHGVLLAAGQEHEVWLPEGATAYDLMTIVAENSEFEFRGKNFWGMGFFVEEINGIAQNPKGKMYWIYYINGEKALVGVSQYVIQTNDVIEWKYEKEI